MSTSQTRPKNYQEITPPSSIGDASLTPSPRDQKAFTQASRVIALFKKIKAGRHIKQNPWTTFKLARGEYDEIERQLRRNKTLFGYVKDKIRYDYNGRNLLIVRMPTAVHELLICGVEHAIEEQLDVIRSGSDGAALFAQKVYPARSTIINFPVDDASPGEMSKHEPDSSYCHTQAKYPGVIIEVSYSQKRKMLHRLAEDYLLDSNASVQVVVGLDIEYGKKDTRKATLSVWRARVFHFEDGDELRVVQEIADEAFRDDQGGPTDHPGLQLQLADFANEQVAQVVTGDQGRKLVVSAQQLCQYLSTAETRVRERHTLSENPIIPGLKKRKRSVTPPEEITSDDEARYTEQERRASKRRSDDDLSYQSPSVVSDSSDEKRKL